MRYSSGFTLIELLVVVAIIGLLASIVLTSVAGARGKAKDSQRLADIRSIQNALELYAGDNSKYPSTGGAWHSECIAWGSTPGVTGFTPDQVAPGLTPVYLSAFPADPEMKPSNNQNCFLYKSNGTSYKLLDYNLVGKDVGTQPAFVDPDRNQAAYWATHGGTTCGANADTNPAWGVWSDTASKCW